MPKTLVFLSHHAHPLVAVPYILHAKVQTEDLFGGFELVAFAIAIVLRAELFFRTSQGISDLQNQQAIASGLEVIVAQEPQSCHLPSHPIASQ